MFLSRHKAVVAGLALSLSLGGVAAPKALAEPSRAEDGADAGDGSLMPEGWDRADAYEEAKPGVVESIISLFSGTPRLSPMNLSNEMKYFAENESGSNYRLASGDSYNAMGFYQFDRRYALVPFMEACYSYNSQKYAMFKPIIDRKAEVMSWDSNPFYQNGEVTAFGQQAQDAWYAAYDNDPTEFSGLQDAYAYENYYLQVENILRDNFGVDISDRADCVKGLAWSLCNLFGSGGCQDFFKAANLKDSMTDRELVNAICDSVVKNVYAWNYDWADSYASRYERERQTCLGYIAEDEQEAAKPENPAPDGSAGSDSPSTEPGPGPAPTPEEPSVEPEPEPGEGSASEPEPVEPTEPAGPGDGAEESGDSAEPDAPGDEVGEPSDEPAGDSGAAQPGGSGNGADNGVSAGDAADDKPAGGEAADGGASGSDEADQGQEPGEEPSDSDGSTDSAGTGGGSTSEEKPGGGQDPEQKPEAATKYTVTFTVKGQDPKTVQVESGKTVGKPESVASFKGYDFAGWYLPDATEPFDFSTPITGDITLEARYLKKSDESADEKVEKKSEEDEAKPTAEPEGLPQTGDMSALFTMAAAGAAMAGTSLTALGIRRRKQQD